MTSRRMALIVPLSGLLGSCLWAIWLVVIGVLLFRRVNGGARAA
jgi:hypothetical protein